MGVSQERGNRLVTGAWCDIAVLESEAKATLSLVSPPRGEEAIGFMALRDAIEPS